MSNKIRFNNAELNLEQNKVAFYGYINTGGKLLYHAQAEAVLNDFLQDRSLDDLLSEINGAFRLIFLKDNILSFTIDHFGGYTLFYKIRGNSLELFDNPMLFAGKEKLNDNSVCSILASGFTLGQDTIFEEIKECLPGTLYQFDTSSGKLETKAWFSYVSTNEKTLNANELDAILQGLFPETERNEYTLSLSGGMDSRFLLGILLNKSKPFQAYSFGSELNKDKFIAMELAEQFQIQHFTHNFTSNICREHYSGADLDFIIKNCTFGRSLPNETDLLSSKSLNPEKNIICKGFGGDWLTGRYITPPLLKIKTSKQMTNYLFNKYFQLTCLSSQNFRNNLYDEFDKLMQTEYYPFHPSLVSAAEQWNQHHNERKYIINTLAYYKARDYKFYLPFYDRGLLEYFARLKFKDKTDQNAYFTYLRERFFSGRLAPLKENTSLRPNFLVPIRLSLTQKLKSTAHNLLREIDPKKQRKRFARPSLAEYADSLMLFNCNFQTLPYLRNKIRENFPETNTVSRFLSDSGCPEAAKHIDWLSKQSTAQININGLSLCKFFFNKQFIQSLTGDST